MIARSEFPYHQGIAPMIWALFALSLIELAAVHFFVALKWPWIGWPLTIISAIAAVWLAIWIVSFRRHPHTLVSGELLLRLGNMKAVRVELSNIAQITSSWDSGAERAKDAINLTGIAYPNRCVVLSDALANGRSKVFIRLDKVSEFDAAHKSTGVEVK